jgi:hypothetical protein
MMPKMESMPNLPGHVPAHEARGAAQEAQKLAAQAAAGHTDGEWYNGEWRAKSPEVSKTQAEMEAMTAGEEEMKRLTAEHRARYEGSPLQREHEAKRAQAGQQEEMRTLDPMMAGDTDPSSRMPEPGEPRRSARAYRPADAAGSRMPEPRGSGELRRLRSVRA